MARNTEISVVRSRMAMAMVLAVTIRMATSTARRDHLDDGGVVPHHLQELQLEGVLGLAEGGSPPHPRNGGRSAR